MSDDDERAPGGLFPKGRSGNPRGRPRKDRSVGGAILSAMNETIMANDNGRRRRVSKLEATAKQFANKGAAGDSRAGKIAIDLAARAEQQAAAAQPKDVRLTQSDVEIVERFLAEHRLYLKDSGQ